MPRKNKPAGLKLYEPGALKDSPSWYIRGTYRGVRIFKSTGHTQKPPAGYIRTQERLIDKAIERQRCGPAQTITFADATALYLETCPDGEIPYIDRLLEHFGETLVAEIDNPALRKAAKKLYPDVTPQTRNRNCMTPAASILHAAHDEWGTPYIRVKKFREPKIETTWATPEMAGAIIQTIAETRTFQSPRIRGLAKGPGRTAYPQVACLFFFTTGRRMADGINLDWDHVDLTKREAYIETTKNGEPLTIPLNDEAFAAIANLPHRTGRVFGYRTRRQFLDDWHAVCKTLGIEYRREKGGLTPHAMRHSFGTWLRQQGLDKKGIMEAGDWKDEKSVNRYLHAHSDERRKAVNMLPKLVKK